MDIIKTVQSIVLENKDESIMLFTIFILLSISYYGYMVTVTEPLAVPAEEAGKESKANDVVTEDSDEEVDPVEADRVAHREHIASVLKPVSPKKKTTSKSPSRKAEKSRSNSPKVSSNTSSKSKSRKVVPKYSVGSMVEVEPMNEPGLKMKDGGVAKITKSFVEDGEVFYAVTYVLGGKESAVEEEFISLQQFEDTSKRGRAPSRKVAESNNNNNKGKKNSRSSNSRSKSTGRRNR